MCKYIWVFFLCKEEGFIKYDSNPKDLKKGWLTCLHYAIATSCSRSSTLFCSAITHVGVVLRGTLPHLFLFLFLLSYFIHIRKSRLHNRFLCITASTGSLSLFFSAFSPLTPFFYLLLPPAP